MLLQQQGDVPQPPALQSGGHLLQHVAPAPCVPAPEQKKNQMSLITGVYKVTKLNLPVSVVKISVGHSNCLVRVKIMWAQHPKSSPKSSWRLPSKHQSKYRKVT